MELLSAMRLSSSSGVAFCRLARSSTAGRVRSVKVAPGCTQVTLMPKGPSSSARFLLSDDTATLRSDPTMLPVWRAARPLMLTMRPHPLAFMLGTTACAQRM